MTNVTRKRREGGGGWQKTGLGKESSDERQLWSDLIAQDIEQTKKKLKSLILKKGPHDRKTDLRRWL